MAHLGPLNLNAFPASLSSRAGMLNRAPLTSWTRGCLLVTRNMSDASNDRSSRRVNKMELAFPLFKPWILSWSGGLHWIDWNCCFSSKQSQTDCPNNMILNPPNSRYPNELLVGSLRSQCSLSLEVQWSMQTTTATGTGKCELRFIIYGIEFQKPHTN